MQQVLGIRDVRLLLGTHAGPRAAHAISQVSRNIGSEFSEILLEIVKSTPGYVYVIGGSMILPGPGGLQTHSYVECFDPLSGQWSACLPMMCARSGACIGLVLGKIYVCGGYCDGGKRLKSVECFDIRYDQASAWTAAESMLSARAGAAASTIGGKIYVCGGEGDGATVLNSVEVFSSAKSDWQPHSPMRQRRQWAAAGAINGALYVCGGIDSTGYNHRPLSNAEYMREGQDVWQNVCPMSQCRARAAAAVVGGKFYVCGGRSGPGEILSSAEKFDPEADSWEALPPMCGKRARGVAVATAGCIYVFGGDDGNGLLNSAESYNTDQALWSPVLSPMKRECFGSVAAVAWR